MFSRLDTESRATLDALHSEINSRSAALRDGSPPRHAKRASGTPGLRRKEKFLSALLRHG
ncbi:MAG TPA: hypothetical protein VKV30_10535 [Candidatus Angelobacter sp.]|nr:hypothetical protein [Candidatus Angelobacter sp.]